MLGSIAAYGTVQDVSAATRQVVIRTASGALLDMSPGQEFRGMGRLRPGQRLIVQYDTWGVVRLGFPRAQDTRRSGRIRGAIQDVVRGGRQVSISDQQGMTVTFEVPDAAMKAFVTRPTPPGDEVAATVLGQQ